MAAPGACGIQSSKNPANIYMTLIVLISQKKIWRIMGLLGSSKSYHLRTHLAYIYIYIYMTLIVVISQKKIWRVHVPPGTS